MSITPKKRKLAVVILCTLAVLSANFVVTYSQHIPFRAMFSSLFGKPSYDQITTSIATAASSTETERTIFNDVWDKDNHAMRFSGNSGGGTGDASTNTSSSVDGEIALFSGTTGKILKRATGTGFGRVSSGVLSTPAELSGDCTSAAFVVTCTKLNNAVPFQTNPQTGTYQVVAADFSGYKTITVASGTFNITLVASGSQPANGLFIRIINYGSGVVTIVRSGQNINGGTTSLTLPAGSATAPTGAFVASNGADYFVSLFGTASSGGSGTVASGNVNETARYSGTGTTVGGSTGLMLSATGINSTKNTVTAISTDTVLSAHNIVACTSGSGIVTATLPGASTSTVGEYTVIKVDSGTGTCQIARAGSDTLNGQVGPVILSTQWASASVELVDAGSPGNWYVVAAKAQLGYINLPITAAKLPTSNGAVIDQSESRPKLLFDVAPSWCASWTVQLNNDYGTVPVVLYTYSMSSATTGSAILGWYVWKTTSDEAVDGQTESYDSVNTCTDASVPGTAGRVRQKACSLTNNDSMLANDLITIKVCRDISDTATGYLELMGAQLQYIKS